MNDPTYIPDTNGLPAHLEHAEKVLSYPHASGGEINLFELMHMLWKGKYLILIAAALSAVVAVVFALSLPNQYTATVILMPASTSGTSSLSRLAGQFGGLASLAGINLSGQGGGDKTIAAIELLKSWGIQEQFIRDNHLEVPVYAAKGWNRLSNQLLIDTSIYDVHNDKWVRKHDLTQGQVAEPSGWELYKGLSERLSVSQDKKTSLITLSIEYYSPYLAKSWVEGLVTAVNKHMQEQDRLEAEKSIQYLEEKMGQTSLIEMKAMFARLIEEQTKNLMLARVSDEYVLKTLSPAKVPEEKSSPKRAMICLLATLGGGLLSISGWLSWQILNARRARAVIAV